MPIRPATHSMRREDCQRVSLCYTTMHVFLQQPLLSTLSTNWIGYTYDAPGIVHSEHSELSTSFFLVKAINAECITPWSHYIRQSVQWVQWRVLWCRVSISRKEERVVTTLFGNDTSRRFLTLGTFWRRECLHVTQLIVFVYFSYSLLIICLLLSPISIFLPTFASLFSSRTPTQTCARTCTRTYFWS